MPYKDPEKQREFRKEYARKRREKGLCAQCSQPVKPGFGRCADHLSPNPTNPRNMAEGVKDGA